MRYAESNVFSAEPDHEGKAIVIEVASSSNPNKKYRVDLTNGRCSCPGWTRHANKDGSRNPCKHLRALGYSKIVEHMDVAELAKTPAPALKVTK